MNTLTDIAHRLHESERHALARLRLARRGRGAPFIMMSQNRQAAIDRAEAKHDYDVNLKAELEIELLHEKADLLREREILELTKLLRTLEDRLAALIPPAGKA